MSHAVDPTDLATVSEPYGNTPFLLYSGEDRSPRVNHVVVEVADGRPTVVVRGIGRGVRRCVDAKGPLSLLWPALEPGGFSLIADGLGTLATPADGAADDNLSLTIHIDGAVLHRPAPVDGNAAC